MNDERAQILAQLLEADPRDTFSRFALGLELWQQQPELALQHFETILSYDQNYVPAYFQLGRLLAEQGQLDKARGWIERGIEIAEQVGDHHALGEMQDFLNDLDL